MGLGAGGPQLGVGAGPDGKAEPGGIGDGAHDDCPQSVSQQLDPVIHGPQQGGGQHGLQQEIGQQPVQQISPQQHGVKAL